MEFRLSEEQKLSQRAVAAFVDAKVAPVAAELEAKGEFPLTLFSPMRELAYFGLRYAGAYGRAGARPVRQAPE